MKHPVQISEVLRSYFQKQVAQAGRGVVAGWLGISTTAVDNKTRGYKMEKSAKTGQKVRKTTYVSMEDLQEIAEGRGDDMEQLLKDLYVHAASMTISKAAEEASAKQEPVAHHRPR